MQLYKKIIITLILIVIFSLSIPKISHLLLLDEKDIKDAILVIINHKLLKIDRTGEFRIYFINKYNFPLKNLRLDVESQHFVFNTKVTPASIPELLPEQPDYFTVKLNLKKNYSSDTYTLYPTLKVSKTSKFGNKKNSPLTVKHEELKGIMKKSKGNIEQQCVVFPLGELEVVIDENLSLKTYIYFAVISLIVFIIIIRAIYNK